MKKSKKISFLYDLCSSQTPLTLVHSSFIHYPTLYPAQYALSGDCLPEGILEYAWGAFQTGRFGDRGDVGHSIQDRLNSYF